MPTSDRFIHQSELDPFGVRLERITAERGRLCVGIDPHPELLASWGLPAGLEGLEQFTDACVDAFVDTAGVVKPQVAFFEAFGSYGMKVLEDAIAALRQAGVLVIADAKRGDIGSTMAAYGRAWLSDDSPLSCDALTVSPYLGFGALSSVADFAQAHGRGLFVLAATSNPEGADVQTATDSHGRALSQQIVDAAAARNSADRRSGVCGSIGVVVGATLDTPPRLSELGGPVLLPGVGAQGASAADVARIADGVERYALPSISRQILQQGPSVKALADAVSRAQEEYPL